VDRCVTDTNRIEQARIDRSMVMWGMRMPQLIDQTAASLRGTLGI